MTSPSDFRRTDDGLIDFDYYRRAAARARARSNRRLFRRFALALRKAFSGSGVAPRPASPSVRARLTTSAATR